MSTQFDVAVIGLGAMGAAAAAHLAARGAKVIGIEAAAHPVHALGSSHGDSRMIRLGYFEDPSYVPLLRRAYANWRGVEERLGEKLLTITGVLQIGRPASQIVMGARASSQLHGLACGVFDREEALRRFPAFALDADEIAVLDPEGGFLRPEAAVRGYLKLAEVDGAVLHFRERVTAIDPDGDGVAIVTDAARYRAAKVVVATGPWIAELVPQLRGRAVPIRQVVAWYRPRDGFAATVGRMPAFIRDEGEAGSFFGFPMMGPDGVKVGRHTHFGEEIDPELPNPPVNDADLAMLDDFIARRIPAVRVSHTNAVTCRYTMLPSEDFLLDFSPSDPRIVVASPCSGHGFKFASVVGEILADLALEGGTPLPVDAFSFAAIERFMRHETEND